MLSCPPYYQPSPLPETSYFAALGEVNRARRTSDTLVLTGPDVTLTYQLR